MNCSPHNNDAFRKAFLAIMRASVIFMDHDAYFSDILLDAEKAASLHEGKHFYLMVRRLGTNYYDDIEMAVDYMHQSHDGMAVLRVSRNKYDSFSAKVLITEKDGWVPGWEEK